MNYDLRQYEPAEWMFDIQEPESTGEQSDSMMYPYLCADFSINGKSTEVKGFLLESGKAAIRFLPEETGEYYYHFHGFIEQEGVIKCLPALPGRHGIVRAAGTHFRYADGAWFYPFGTTVYALSHQADDLVEETFTTLSEAPFNKIRMCVFPKHYDYNQNEPPCFPFEKKRDGWDVYRPDPVFWNRLESHIRRLDEMGIQCDLILFHPYDRWGFSKLPPEEALVYLDYAIRRLAAFPNLWWSLANEYDLMAYEKKDWEAIERFVAEHDPWHHLLSCHQILRPWHWESPFTTHISSQTRELDHISVLIRNYQKPMIVDECCYEGDLPHNWGNISGFELVHRFWTVAVQGGYCTHGETFLSDDDVIWWAKGGKLKGNSPRRIAFLKSILESLPGPIVFGGKDRTDEELTELQQAMPEPEKGTIEYLMKHFRADELRVLLDQSREFAGCIGDEVFIRYYGHTCPGLGTITLPEEKHYDLEVIDIWDMTRDIVLTGVSGKVQIPLPGKEGIALLARAQRDKS